MALAFQLHDQNDLQQQVQRLGRRIDFSFPFVFDVLSVSFYHRSRVSARLVANWPLDTFANIGRKYYSGDKKYFFYMESLETSRFDNFNIRTES